MSKVLEWNLPFAQINLFKTRVIFYKTDASFNRTRMTSRIVSGASQPILPYLIRPKPIMAQEKLFSGVNNCYRGSRSLQNFVFTPLTLGFFRVIYFRNVNFIFLIKLISLVILLQAKHKINFIIREKNHQFYQTRIFI